MLGRPKGRLRGERRGFGETAGQGAGGPRGAKHTQAGCTGGGSVQVRGSAAGYLPRQRRAELCGGLKTRAGLVGNKGRGLSVWKDAWAEGRGPAAQRRGATSVEGRRTPGYRTATVRPSSRR